MAVIVKIMGAWDGITPHDGRYLVAWNSDTRFGDLHCTSTDDKRAAAPFHSISDAMEEWGRRSNVEPNRPNDGKPNRPLTALTIEFEEVD